MKTSLLSPSLAVLSLLAAPSAAHALEPAPELAAPRQAEASEFGEPVIVNGRQIPDLEVKRFLAYGVGQTILGTDRLAILIEREFDYRAGALEAQYLAEMFPGKAASDLSEAERGELQARVDGELAQYRLSDEYLAWLLEKREEVFDRMQPTLDYATELKRAYGATEWYYLQARRSLEFDACFFQGDPDTWPELTKEALRAGSSEVDLLQDMKDSWDRRKAAADASGAEYVRREDETYFATLRGLVIDLLGSLIEEETAVHGLPPELLIRMRGDGWTEEIRTEDVWERLAPHVTEQDIRIAKRWLATMAATNDRLEAEGYLWSEEQHHEHVEKTEREMEETLFSIEYIAMTGYGFPSSEAFLQYLRPLESYRSMLFSTGVFTPADKKLSAVVKDYFPIANKTLGREQADIDVLFVGAFDQEKQVWLEDGWARAKAEAERLRAEIDAHLDGLETQSAAKRRAVENGENWQPEVVYGPFEEFWHDLLDKHSEFYDAPMPAQGKGAPAETLYDKGRFTSQLMADIARSVDESTFTRTLTGRSIADRVMLDMQVGEIGGPFRGPYGYYIVYLQSRSGPSRNVDIRAPKMRRLLEEYYHRTTFADFAQESLLMAETSGVPEV